MNKHPLALRGKRPPAHRNQHSALTGPAPRATSGAPRRLRPLCLALAAALGVVAMSPANAFVATYTWTSTVDSWWTTTSNWRGVTPEGGVVINGVPHSGDTVVFNNNKNTHSGVNLQNLVLAGMSFASSAGAFDFYGYGFGVGLAGISNASANHQQFNALVTAQGDQTWDGGSGAGMGFSQAALGAGSATFTLARNISIGSFVSSSIGSAAGDIAALNVLGGSSTVHDTLTLGRDVASMGTVLVDGPSSSLRSTGALVVGLGGTGTLTVQAGATLTSGHAFIGQALSGDGQVLVSGVGSTWVGNGDLTIGDAGFGRLTLSAGAQANHGNATLGNLAGSAGSATVDGAQSRWLLAGNLQVGNQGEGFLTVSAGGRVSSQSAGLGQDGDAGTSKALVTGAGSRWDITADLQSNTAYLDIFDGGVVTARNAMFGVGAGSGVLVSLAGTDALLNVTDTLSLGVGGVGSLSIGSGATVATDRLLLGSGGIVTLNGGRLMLNTSSGDGLVNWNSGQVVFNGSASTGSGLLGHDVAMGQGMQLLVARDLSIAATDSLSLNGGQAQALSWAVKGELNVGSFSALSVGANGLLNTGAVQLFGGQVISAGTIVNAGRWTGYGVISGAGGFSNTGLLQQSGGSLELATTGSNSNTGNWNLLDGRGLVLSGASLLNAGMMSLNGDTISGTALLKNGATGTLTGHGAITTPFENAGRVVVDAGNLRIAQNNFANSGQILMGSAGATLAGGFFVNNGLIEGLGQVNNPINNLGTIGAVGGRLSLAGALRNDGTLTAGQGATLSVLALDSNAGKIRLAGGTLDSNGRALLNEAKGVISGYGSLNGGTLSNQGRILLSGGSSSVDVDVVSANASQIVLSGNSNTTFYGKVDVQSGAELRVSGGSVATFFEQVQQRTGAKFTGTGTKRFEGGLTVGASPGLGTDAGDVEFGDSNAYLAEIGGVTACTLACGSDPAFKNSSFDKYIVAGNLSLGGILRLTSWNGFVGQAGQHYDLFDWGTATGSFASIDASGFLLAAGTQLDYSALYSTGTVAVTATPVPEPGTLALWLAGVAGLAGIAKRRRLARCSVSVRNPGNGVGGMSA